MDTEIYKIDNEGEISLFAIYGLSKEQSLKNAVLQYLSKRWDTWNYDKIFVPIKSRNGDYYFPFSDNSMLFTRSPK